MHEISWHRSGTGGNWFEHLGFSLRFEREKRLALWKAGFFYRTFKPRVVGSSPTGLTTPFCITALAPNGNYVFFDLGKAQ